MLITFDKIVGIVRSYDRSGYLTLFGTKKYDTIYDKTRYLISIKYGITYTISYYFAKIKVDSYDTLPIEKTLTLHNVIIHFKSVLKKDKSHYYHKIFFRKMSVSIS